MGLKRRILGFFTFLFITIFSAHAMAVEYPFIMTTTPDTTEFSFNISAAGTFYIDWGDGNTETIEKTRTNYQKISYTYATANEYIIKLGGQATGYSSSAAISFYNNTNLAKIDGSLGMIFSTLSDGSQPIFNGTFRDCANLTGKIPENLFTGISGEPATHMFAHTFSGCSGLTGQIPQGLFGNLTGSPAEWMFDHTFYRCSNLSGPIPQGLFGNLTGSPAGWMFYSTFEACSNLSGPIPQGLFGNLTGSPTSSMFRYTFFGCSNLESFIPPTLFAGIDTPDIATATDQMSLIFYDSGIVTQCPVGYYQYMTGFEEYFDGRVSCTPCPAGYTNAGPGLTSESQCVMTVDPGYYIKNPGDTEPTICPAGSYCAGGDVPYGQTGPINTCPENSSSESGASVCTCNDGFINNGGTTTTTNACVSDYKFFMTTTPDTTEFSFRISAAGTFYIDWGDGKTETIEKANTGEQTVSHSYSNAGAHEIKLGGQATGYGNYAAISFYENKNLAKIDGSLGAIFSTLSDGSQPIFNGTFRDCANLTSEIPAELFSGITGAPAEWMFTETFYYCTGLTGNIPANLFAGIEGKPAYMMFYRTFAHCYNLTGSIPADLFVNISGEPADGMFGCTFEGCSGLTGSIPENLFKGIEGKPAIDMFSMTFYRCSGLTGTIPENLFAGIKGVPAYGMFGGTFEGCSGLTGSIPEKLFAGIEGAPASTMFASTFSGCSNLESFIPPTLFAGIDTPDIATEAYQMSSIFYDSGIVTQCPVGYYQYMTGFEEYFDERVSCTPCPAGYTTTKPGATSIEQCFITVNPGEHIKNPGDTTPTQCPAGSYCAGGNVPYGSTGPINACPENSSSEPGASVCTCNPGFINNGGTTTTTNACVAGYKFFITTTPDTTEFSFQISAAGTFYIDWGDGNTETIEKTNTDEQTVSHTYSSADEYVIKLGGQATRYGNDMTISFYRNKKLSRLDGCLGAIFSTLSNGSQPRFGNAHDSTINQSYGAFTDCINLTQIPGTLFTTFDTNGSIIGGINGAPIPYMFAYTFSGCSGLTSIPDRLFAGLIGKPAEYMFYNTFGYFSYYDGTPYSSNCSNITGSIPENLFAGIEGEPAEWMFSDTFNGCSGLTSIPGSLFAGIEGAPAEGMFSYTFRDCSGLAGSIPKNLFADITGAPAYAMFSGTFEGCSGLSGNIPENLFAGIEGEPASSMFGGTFDGCSGLTGSIPEKLFAGIEGEPASSMFSSTFSGCSGLSGSIPENLFAGIEGAPANSMFGGTFYGCSGLTGNIPENLFAGIEGEPASSMFSSTFYGCSGLSGSIPTDLFGDISGNVKDQIFSSTFSGCSGLTGSIPSGLFGNLSGRPQYSMFSHTFFGCSNLSGPIPQGLFGNLTGAPFAFMFDSTFKDCSNLTGSIPDDLFSNISGAPEYRMFANTFDGCSNLESFIPPTLFAGIDTPDVATAAQQMSNLFLNSGIVTQCPVGYYQYMTGFEEYFDERVSCTPCPAGYTNAGPGLTSESQCVMTVEPGYYIENPGDTEPTICPNGSYCIGGDVPYGQTGPINACPAVTNPYGAVDAKPRSKEGLSSIEKCTAEYLFAEEYFAVLYAEYSNDYDKTSFANKRGTYATTCHYNPTTKNYDKDCFNGSPIYFGCAGGYYFSNADKVDWVESFDLMTTAVNTESLSQAIEQICIPTDVDHWSPGLQDCYDKYTTDEERESCMISKIPNYEEFSLFDLSSLEYLWSQHPCPENSSTRGLTGQEYCVCDDGYTVDGTTNGATTTMYDACIKAEIILTYDVNGANGAVAQQTCPAGSPCDIKTPSQIGHDMYRPGYVFNGWALNANDTTPIDYQYTFNENTTVYAIWTPCANGTYKTADANAGEQCSACSDLGTEYTFSEIASTSASQCRTECMEYSVVYGTAIPLEQYKFWPNKCEYRGESITGNPCDIIDGVCVEKSCNYDYEMINGRCQACNREHALTYKPTGNCVVATCGYGYHADGQYCVGDTKECSAPNAISAHQVWDTNKNAFSECLITECESGYHVSENVCQLDDQTCELEHGVGEREWDDQTNSWGKCVATYCEPGYTNDPDQTNESWEQCGRCNNMYTSDGIMAVSSYVQGCEIASCMNQGEQFILDGNECRLICDEYSDETGRRYWDGKKCVHECAGGYTQW